MSKIKRLFKIIKDYFNSIFNRQKVKLIEETTTITSDTELEVNDSEKNRKEENVFNNIFDYGDSGVFYTCSCLCCCQRLYTYRKHKFVVDQF